MALPDYTTQDAATYKANIDSSMDSALVIGDAETTITNTDAKVPTSGAVFDKVAGLNSKILNIGDWDMSVATGTASVSITHGVTGSKIRTATASIIRDGSSFYVDFMATNNNETAGQSHYISWSSTSVTLVRAANGYFDNTNYDFTPFDRGWITIQYTD